jgi:hypothetical protein
MSSAQDENDGQVSEAENLAGDPETPIQPDQAVAGAPTAESGEAQEGTAGPNARPRNDEPGAEPPD